MQALGKPERKASAQLEVWLSPDLAPAPPPRPPAGNLAALVSAFYYIRFFNHLASWRLAQLRQ